MKVFWGFIWLSLIITLFVFPFSLAQADHDRPLTASPDDQGRCESGYSLNTNTNTCELTITHLTPSGGCPSKYDKVGERCILLRTLTDACGPNEIYDNNADRCVPNTPPGGSDGTGGNGNPQGSEGENPPSDPNVFNLSIEDPIFGGEGGDVFVLLDRIINTLMLLAVPVAIIMVVYAAFLYTTSGGNEEKVKTANRTLLYVVIGFAVLLLAKSVTGIAKEIVGTHDAGDTEIPMLLEIGRVIANVLIAVVGILSVIFIVLAGLQFATSGGDEEKVKKAKNYILYAIIGLVVALLSFGVTSIVNELIRRAQTGSSGEQRTLTCPTGSHLVVVRGAPVCTKDD